MKVSLRSFQSIVIILLSAACVERISFDLGNAAALSVTIAENLAAQISDAELEAVMAELEQLPDQEAKVIANAQQS